MRIEINNYEGIEHAVVEVEGFTLLVGPTHSAKSASLRAVETALYNLSGDYYIKSGTGGCSVSLQIGGKDWVWTKSGTTRLHYDGELYTKLGRGAPLDLLKEVGFAPVEVDGISFKPHFQNQLSGLFAVSEKKTTLFNLLLAFSKYAKLPDVRKKVDRDAKDWEKQRLSLEGQTELLKVQLERAKEAYEVLNSDLFLRYQKEHSSLSRVYDCNELEENYSLLEGLNLSSGPTTEFEDLLGQLERYHSLQDLLRTEQKTELIPKYSNNALWDLDSDLQSLEELEGLLKLGGKADLIPKSVSLGELESQVANLEETRILLTDINRLQSGVNQSTLELESLEITIKETQELIGSVEECPECGALPENWRLQ